MQLQKSISNLILILVTVCYLSACSISPKVQAVQIGDDDLTKQELLAEIRRLDSVEREINHNRGFNFTNLAAVMFWLPGLAVTMLDSYEASGLVNERKSHLNKIYNRKFRGQQKEAVALADHAATA